MSQNQQTAKSAWWWAALVLGPLLCGGVVLMAPPAGLGLEAWRLVGLSIWMVLWWTAETVPLPVTALLPIPLMPLLGIVPETAVAAQYGHPLIFLFLGGLLIGQSLQKWGLHRRIALAIVLRLGHTPSGLLGGFMLATAFLSMWISNTATAVMMFAVGLAVIQSLGGVASETQTRRFGVALVLAIAYSASIGGVGTLIGTPPNALLAAYLREAHGYTLDMQRWFWIGLPFVGLMLPLAWFWLSRPLRGMPWGDLLGSVRQEYRALGPLGRAEGYVLGVFLLAVLGWILRPQLTAVLGITLSDSAVALLAALLLFVIPAPGGGRLLDWDSALKLPWGVLLLFAGGLALASAFEATGLSAWIGAALAAWGSLPPWVLVLCATLVVIFLTELTSNTAVAATFLPVMGALAQGLGLDARLLAIPVAVASSAAFMLPVATPPNAIVFAYEGLRIHHMVRAGFVLNLATVLVIVLILLTLGRWGLGINL
ncbi:SLC13 family permease [Meiothermus cerbereus]|uniref:SLC13 family permease n=1 Tax=Meiothermus cerbereus TaxID=65552 RepID=UPI0006868CD1|nr:DASS family sodium-coupled anion symporter [Meiothermus cerbereus]